MKAKFTNELFCDLETYSERNLKVNGTHSYAEKSEIMLFAWALNDEPAQVWDKTDGSPMPEELRYHLYNQKTLTIWHNGGNFDRTIMKHAMGFQLSFQRIHDTMVQALCHALPGALDKLCDVLAVPFDKAKDKEGKQWIKLFCCPRPKNQKLRRATRETHPKEWEKFKDYAKLDIEAMRVVYRKMPTWNYSGREKTLWQLDQKINNRGVKVDTELAEAAIEAIAKAQEGLSARTQEITLGEVESTNQRDALLKFIADYWGIYLPDMQKANIERVLQDTELPWAFKELLAIRLQASTTSTSKYKRLLKTVSADGRLRGLLQFAGASRTLRWAGRIWQPQNLPRPTHKQKDIDFAIEALKAGCLDLCVDDVMKMISSMIRGCIVAADGYKLIASDLSNIEGRAAAWLAGEDWKLQAFRDYDNGTGPDLYILAYAKSFAVRPEGVNKDKRQLGKVQELALGYEGGVGAFATFTMTYKMDLNKVSAAVLPSIPADVLAESTKAWQWARRKQKTLGLEKNVYIACDALKRMWRDANPAISSFWPEISAAAREAIQNPGRVVDCRKLKFYRKGAWLRMLLPSGRSVCYASPRVDHKGAISYAGMNQYSRKWSRINTYGGKLLENACQALSRDIMAYNMPFIDDQGYRIILTVHDEIITETPDNDKFTHHELSELLAYNPPWAADMPLAAGGFESHRYKKD